MDFNVNTFKEVNGRQNYIVKSQLFEFHSDVESSGLSIKLPQTGVEIYNADGKEYKIKGGEFLVVNKGQDVNVDLESKELVESICIYLNSQIYSDIFESLKTQENLDFEVCSHQNFVQTEKYFIQDCGLSAILSSIATGKDFSAFGEEEFILIAEKLAHHQAHQQNLIRKIKAHNYITKTEMMKRLRIAKSFIFDNYSKDINLDLIAQISCLSKYHLLRSFKDVYHVTPYQALLERRINVATNELKKDFSIEDVAVRCGFSDRRSFSRVFKKFEGLTPSTFQDRKFSIGS